MITSILENISRVMIGMTEVTQLMLAAFFAGGHVLLEDMPGTGKTLLARSMAKSMDLTYTRIQFTPDLLPGDVTGINYFHQKKECFVFRKGPVFTNILLADEINRATPRTQSALLESMAERQITVDGETYLLEPPFFVIATQNPVETYGCFPLPEAQLDRFLMKLEMEPLSLQEEVQMLGRFMKDEPLETLNPVVTAEQIRTLCRKCREVTVHDDLQRYMAELVRATRRSGVQSGMREGVSPRGTLALMRAAQGFAMVKGRDFVTPEDIKTVAVPVLAHRLICEENTEREKQNRIRALLSTIAVPTEHWK